MYTKLLFIAPILKQIGGIEKTAKELKSACENRNINFRLMTLVSTPDSDFSYTHTDKYISLMSLFFGKTFSFFMVFYFIGLLKKKEMREFNSSVVICRSAALSYALVLLKRKFNLTCKIVYLPSHFSHDLYFPIIVEAKKKKKILSVVKNRFHIFSESFFEKRLLVDDDSQIVTFSYNLLDRLINTNTVSDSKILRVIRPGVSSDIITSNIEKCCDVPKIRFLYVGRIDTGKNVERLLELFINSKFESAHLSIVGDGAIKSTLEKRFESNASVSFLGAKQGTELSKLYGSASYLIIPTFFESYGHVISEALCCGTPVIGYSFLGCKNAVAELIKTDENGILIKADTQEAFDAMMFEAQDKIMFFNSISEQIKLNSLKKFSWNNFIDELLNGL